MLTRLRTVIAATLLLLAAGQATATAAETPAAQGSTSHCFFRGYTVTTVEPHYEWVRLGKMDSRRLRGAEVYIQAERGLTAEWLRLEITRHLAAMKTSAMPDCSLDLDHIKVTVNSAGAGFQVTIRTEDDDHGQEVLRRAQSLLTVR